MPAYRLTPAKTTTDEAGRKICEIFGRPDGHDDISVAWIMLPPGNRGLEERNEFTEVVIVLSGRGRAHIDGAASEVEAGHSIYVPKGARWLLENPGREPLVCYSVAVPAFSPELFHPA